MIKKIFEAIGYILFGVISISVVVGLCVLMEYYVKYSFAALIIAAFLFCMYFLGRVLFDDLSHQIVQYTKKKGRENPDP